MTRRSGIALVAALSLLALLGLAIAGAVASATIAQRAETLALSEGALASSADYALSTVLANPAMYALADLPLGDARSFDVAVPAAGVHAAVAVTRLPAGLLWLVSQASLDTAGGLAARRRVNLIARFPVTGPTLAAPLISRGSISLGAGVVIVADSTPAHADAECVVSTAATPIQTTDSVALFQTARQLAALDSAPGVRHVRGDTVISAGSFDGILFIEGALTVDGPFSLTGLAVVRGKIKSSAGLTVTGGIVSHAAGPGPAIDLAGAVIRYSPCEIGRVLRVAAPPRTARGRSWSELF